MSWFLIQDSLAMASSTVGEYILCSYGSIRHTSVILDLMTLTNVLVSYPRLIGYGVINCWRVHFVFLREYPAHFGYLGSYDPDECLGFLSKTHWLWRHQLLASTFCVPTGVSGTLRLSWIL